MIYLSTYAYTHILHSYTLMYVLPAPVNLSGGSHKTFAPRCFRYFF